MVIVTMKLPDGCKYPSVSLTYSFQRKSVMSILPGLNIFSFLSCKVDPYPQTFTSHSTPSPVPPKPQPRYLLNHQLQI